LLTVWNPDLSTPGYNDVSLCYNAVAWVTSSSAYSNALTLSTVTYNRGKTGYVNERGYFEITWTIK